VNAAPVQGAVDVYINAVKTVSNIAAGANSAYAAQATGAFVITMTTPGTATVVGAAAGYTLQVGTAGTTLADPIFGSGQPGSIFTAFIFDATPVPASPQTAVATPSVVYFPDMQPPRTTSP